MCQLIEWSISRMTGKHAMKLVAAVRPAELFCCTRVVLYGPNIEYSRNVRGVVGLCCSLAERPPWPRGRRMLMAAVISES